MKKPFYLLLIGALLILSCKNKKTNPQDESSFFPVLSFIKSQVAHVDTSVYRIIKVVKTDSTFDTTYLKREEFREAAKDFLSIPDISSDELKDDYTETKLFIQDLGQVALSYMPKKPGKEITRQEVMIKPDGDGDKVQSIFINRINNSKKESVHKILFWEVDKQFKIVTLTQLPDQPEKTETVEVIWNNFPS
jgi:hypothetical protein